MVNPQKLIAVSKAKVYVCTESEEGFQYKDFWDLKKDQKIYKLQLANKYSPDPLRVSCAINDPIVKTLERIKFWQVVNVVFAIEDFS